MSKVFYNAKNLTIGNGFLKNPDRYYLEEYFEQLPATQFEGRNGGSDIIYSSTVDVPADNSNPAFTIEQPANTRILEVGFAMVSQMNS